MCYDFVMKFERITIIEMALAILCSRFSTKAVFKLSDLLTRASKAAGGIRGHRSSIHSIK